MLLNNKRITIATNNQGKLKEFKNLFSKLNISVQGLSDVEGCPEIIEDGSTFAENAEKKARVIAHYLQEPVLADDSGLCVDRLGGEPGVFSARFAGDQATDQMNNDKLLTLLLAQETITDHPLLSAAHFVCALVLYDPSNGESLLVEEVCQGYITSEPRGEYGFGYDPLFFIPLYNKTMAELPPEIKSQISHRGQAMEALLRKMDKT